MSTSEVTPSNATHNGLFLVSGNTPKAKKNRKKQEPALPPGVKFIPWLDPDACPILDDYEDRSAQAQLYTGDRCISFLEATRFTFPDSPAGKLINCWLKWESYPKQSKKRNHAPEAWMEDFMWFDTVPLAWWAWEQFSDEELERIGQRRAQEYLDRILKEPRPKWECAPLAVVRELAREISKMSHVRSKVRALESLDDVCDEFRGNWCREQHPEYYRELD